jgi:hypothetical protein
LFFACRAIALAGVLRFFWLFPFWIALRRVVDGLKVIVAVAINDREIFGEADMYRSANMLQDG